jgi:hypothetical protein
MANAKPSNAPDPTPSPQFRTLEDFLTNCTVRWATLPPTNNAPNLSAFFSFIKQSGSRPQ